MTLQFNLYHVIATEFGVGRDDEKGQTFTALPVDASVQAALLEMAQATWGAMKQMQGAPYEPSEKHASMEYLHISTADELAASIRQLHEAENLAINAAALAEPTDVFCYFARLTDKKGRRLTALRRATQFKGILRSKNRLVRVLDDTLQIIDDTVFKLDADFDLLADADHVHILRPSGFEFAAKLQEAILAAVPKNVEDIRADLGFVDFGGIESYAQKHPRAARYIASIRGQASAKHIDKSALKRLCKRTGVKISDLKGKIAVTEGHEMGFLEVLDRRRYELTLVKGLSERFKAASRTKLDG